MAHPIVDGPVTVLKVVTPGSYWVRCKNCSGTCRTPESIRRKPYSDDFYPPNGAKVFVHDSDGFFYHGTVCGRGEFPLFASMRARMYTVQLTHTFQVKDFDRCHIYPTFGEVSIACEGAHLVSLYRVLPTFPPPEFGSLRESKNVELCQTFVDNIRNWDQSNYVVEELIQRQRKFWYEQLSVISGSFYGKLSFFQTARYINIKDFLASQNIVARVSSRFETVVQSLMTRPLHKCCNLLPLYSPGVVPVPQVAPETRCSPSKPKIHYDLSKFRVHEEDLSLHESLWTETSLNILFTGLNKPDEKEIGIRFIAPDGKIVLGTVLSPHIITYVRDEMDPPPDLLKKYIQERTYSGSGSIFIESNVYANMPPSSDEEDSTSSHGEGLDLRCYDFEERLCKFRHQGGLLEDHFPLSSLPVSHALLELVEMSFDNLNVSTLDDWQLVCLPSLVAGNNVLVIGPPSNKKMTTSIVSTLSLIRGSSEAIQQNGISPIFVILVNDYKRAHQAARLCERLSNLKVITSTYSQISDAQKQEVREGCDILISTPGNWLKLTRDLQCFDCSRVAHVVFDCFELLHKNYLSEIETIIKDMRSIDRVQAIFLSNIWGSFLVDFVTLLGKSTRCVIDLLQACFCYRLEPTVVIVSNDWDELLTSIIQNDQTTLRLLLCHDHLEVTAIKSRMNHLDCVLFAHENEDRQFAIECINQWKSNFKTFLVTSDILFSELDFVQNANLLVSWKQNPCSRSTLIERFMSIRGHAPHERRRIPVYIFCSCDNLEELVFIKHELENVKHPGFLGGDLDECIDSTFRAREEVKTGHHCSSLYMFGQCESIPLCPYRHKFLQQDSIHVFRNNAFLKITIEKLHHAFHMTVRVEAIASNHESLDSVLPSLTSKLSEIEAGLERAFNSFFNGSPKSSVDIKVGDVVGACILDHNVNILRRVKILSVDENDEYEVLMMDFDEPHKTLQVNDLFPLPPTIGMYPRDTVEIFLSKLIPADFNANWVLETKSFLNSYTEMMAENGNGSHFKLLAGAVEAVIERNIIVDSIYWCREEEPCVHVVIGSMKEEVLANKYVTNNPEHLTLLSKLAVDCGKQPFIGAAEEEFGFRRKFSADFNSAVVSAYDNPGLFFVQLSSERAKLAQLETSLTASLSKCRRNLSVIVEDELCSVLIDGVWNRAVIVGKDDAKLNNGQYSETLVTIMCVDYGDERVSVRSDELFCLPEEFIKGIPYFAIECELVGIEPLEDDWSDEVVQEFRKHIRDPFDEMTLVNVKFCGVVNENRYTKYFRHQVALQDANNAGRTINQHLVSCGKASWNPATVDLLLHRAKQPHTTVTRRKKAV